MKKTMFSLSVATLMAIASSGTALAAGTNLDVKFTANVVETTCDMKLVGGEGNDGKQTLTIGGSNGQVRVEDITAGTATGNFKIAIVECPASLSSLKTTIKGTEAGYLPTSIKNSISPDTGGSNYAGVSISRASAPTNWFTPNSTVDAERLVWSQAEIDSKEVALVATLRETVAGKLTVGDFLAVATFEFNYE
ncbi:TPA_asm: fimbrial protein [Salmonella enterica subsp. salamae serovar 60:g,m,t:z6]|uniref:Fimbrial protein n=1 Tax=Salmonella enterica subsp. houtenae serovar 1,40:z4,z32:- TaxID=1967604 RepID=A0A730WMM6_SALHO|nr:fimbrial protein [Salmonella enterica]HAC6700001.1 fimbrial protein [Salmonella bongori serovar 66:z65:-]HAE2267804.1 fimbrial protein [Salmonella enterica subsp. enterica serovar 1,9,12:-:-]HAE4190243.1 fimbrial protein [Salmonella enterica subsp. houtenae serovar 1,40:z4,z32:-]HAE7513793.1 fimbrial protein [Salmonella enterica subsp. salamae serovar 60:g,m,t:z6]